VHLPDKHVGVPVIVDLGPPPRFMTPPADSWLIRFGRSVRGHRVL